MPVEPDIPEGGHPGAELKRFVHQPGGGRDEQQGDSEAGQGIGQDQEVGKDDDHEGNQPAFQELHAGCMIPESVSGNDRPVVEIE